MPLVPQGSKRLPTDSATCFAGACPEFLPKGSVSVVKVKLQHKGIEYIQLVIKRGIIFFNILKIIYLIYNV